MHRLTAALDQIRTARLYVKDLLRHIDEGDWFRQPDPGVTHVAWQVGHLAVAQYGLALRRVRGEAPGDAELIPEPFRRAFGKGSLPEADPARNPSPAEILAVFDRVHESVLRESAALSETTLGESASEPPHPMFKTKLGALVWCGQHELIHAGHIALLRRLFGAAPLR